MFSGAVAAALLALAALPVSAEKTDVIVLVNGDRITGEIKELERGKLRYSTDSADTLQVEWADILSIVSKQTFEFERTDGSIFYGELVDAEADGMLRIKVGAGAVDLPALDVVAITPIRHTIWSRIDGSLGLGFNYTQASQILTFNFAADATYRTRKHEANVEVSSTVTEQSAEPATENQEVTLNYRALRSKNRFISGLAKFERNTELGIDLRTTAGAAYGWGLVRTSHSWLNVGAGINATDEQSGDSSEQSLELMTALEYDLFFYNSPKTDIHIALSILPNLETSGRYRTDTSARLRRELFKDFFLELTGWLKYDSEPPSEATSKSDWYAGLGISWTF